MYYKEIPTQVLSCEYCEIFKNTYFEEHLQTAASVLLIKKLLIKYWATANLFLIKNNMERFLPRTFVDLFRIYFYWLLKETIPTG